MQITDCTVCIGGGGHSLGRAMTEALQEEAHPVVTSGRALQIGRLGARGPRVAKQCRDPGHRGVRWGGGGRSGLWGAVEEPTGIVPSTVSPLLGAGDLPGALSLATQLLCESGDQILSAG